MADKGETGKSRIGLIITNLFFGFSIMILACAITLTVLAKKSGEAVSIVGFRPFIVASGSMEPTYRVNGLVIVHNDNFDDIKVDDVVAFRSKGLGGKPALHRVVAVLGEGDQKNLVTKGDSNQEPDGTTVDKDDYMGRAVWHTNLTAVYFSILQQPAGWIRAIVLPILILILLYFAVRWLAGSDTG